MLLSKEIVNNYKNNGVALLQNAISDRWLKKLAIGSSLPDAVVTLGSIDIVVGEIDR